MTLPGGRLRYVTVAVRDIAASLRFYDAALAGLGLTRSTDYPDEEESDSPVEAAGYAVGAAEAVLWIVADTVATTNAHLAFAARGTAEVETFHRVAVAAGGRSIRSPRRWAIYRAGEFSAVVADPDGNLVEAVTHDEEAEIPTSGVSFGTLDG